MSTPDPIAASPFPEEERALENPSQAIDPNVVGPLPSFWQGFNPITLAPQALEHAAALGEGVLGGAATALGKLYRAAGGTPRPVGLEIEPIGQAIERDAAQHAKNLTPDPTVTGTAAETVHGLVSGLARAGVGAALGGPPGAAAALFTTEAHSQYQQLIDQGVKPETALELAGTRGAFSAAGAYLPMGFGAKLLSKLATGSGGNVGFGIASRYADHEILDKAGYHDMADQQRVMDGTAMLTDLVLGAGFGGLSYLHGPDGKPTTPIRDLPGAEDAALTANLGVQALRGAPGVPVDPASAALHQRALQTAMTQIQQDQKVNVADTGVQSATFARRPEPAQQLPVQELLFKSLKEGGLLENQRNLEYLESVMQAKLKGEEPPAPPERPLTDELPGVQQPPSGKFLALRASNSTTLENANAGNADAVAGFIARYDSGEGPIPKGRPEAPQAIQVHAVTPRGDFGPYSTFNQGQAPGEAGQAIGRQVSNTGTSYSFPAGGAYSSEHTATIPMAAFQRELAARGYGSFDDAGTRIGGDVIRTVVQRHLAGEEAPLKTHTADEIPRSSNLNPAQRAKETRFADQIGGNYDQAVRAYKALPESEGGRVLNTDTARELSPDYLKDRSDSAPVHEPASWLMKTMYAEALSEPAKPGQDNKVIFTAGGTGAGKSTGTKLLHAEFARAQVVYDTNLSTLSSAVTKIEQARAAGKDVQIMYVDRDPVDSLVHGALKRAMRQEAEHGTGRAVPLEEHINTHVGANAVIRELAQRYADDPHVKISIVDNRRGNGNARLIDVAQLPKVEYNSTREAANKALESEFAGGRISASIYRGFAGKEPTVSDTGAAGGQARPGVRGQLEPQRAEERPDQLETVSTAGGRQIEVRHRIAELSDLLTSDKPGYPAELQPRQRGARAALNEQVRDIAANLTPERLGSSPEADRGAPIVSGNNEVESGNGRVMALRQVYEGNPEKAGQYRQFLESEGHDLTGFKQPVLVRERVTPLSPADRAAFTVEANQAATAALSPVERAQADARNLDAGALSQMRGGDLTTAQNAPFVRAFMESIPQAERNALVNPDGTVSQEGVRRIQAALLAKAYGGGAEANAVLGRMLESTDGEMRGALGAMLDAAPAFARLRQAIAEDKVGKEYDVSKALTQAVETVAHLRGEGQALDEFLKQEDFLTKRAPIVENLMRALYDKAGARMAPRDKVAETLMNYADRALKQRLDQHSLFGDAAVAPDRLLAPSQPEEAAAAGARMQPAQDMFGLRTPQGKSDTALRVAGKSLADNPNLEIALENGDTARARSEYIGAAEDREAAQERAPDAMQTLADCAGQRPEAA